MNILRILIIMLFTCLWVSNLNAGAINPKTGEYYPGTGNYDDGYDDGYDDAISGDVEWSESDHYLDGYEDGKRDSEMRNK